LLRGPENADDASLGVRAANGLFSSAMLRALSEAHDKGRG
jgi:hypothetical protein